MEGLQEAWEDIVNAVLAFLARTFDWFIRGVGGEWDIRIFIGIMATILIIGLLGILNRKA